MPLLTSYNNSSFQNIDLSNPVNWDHPLNDGLVAWWLALPQWMGGTRWFDLCGRHHGTLTNMDPETDWVGSDRSGGFGALEFDGVDDYVTLDDSAVPTQYTLMMWVRFDTLRNGNIIVRTNSNGPNKNFSHQLKLAPIQGGYDFEHYLYDGNSRAVSGTTPRWPGQWYHVVGTVRNGNQFKLYIDGALIAAAPMGSLWTGGDRWRIAQSTASGNAGAGTSVNYWKGNLDDFRYYQRELTSAEIASYYNRSRQSYPDLLNRTRCLWLRISTFNEIGSGGIEVAGRGTDRAKYTINCVAKTVASGATTVWKMTPEIASGKSLCSGMANIDVIYEQVARRGVVCGGVAIIQSTVSINSIGSILVGGTPTIKKIASADAIGGVISSASTQNNFTANDVMSGGTKISGQVNVDFMTASVIVVEISGEAIVTTNETEWSTGGAKIGGSSFEEVGCVAPLCEADCGHLGESKANVKVKIGKAVIPAVTACQMGRVQLKHIEQRYTKRQVFVAKEKFPF